MQNNELVEYAPVSDFKRASELVWASTYMRLITPNGSRRISRRDAWQAIIDAMRCADCRGGKSWCDACKYSEPDLHVCGFTIYLDATKTAYITC